MKKTIIDLIWYTLMYSPDGDNEREQYWSAIEEKLEKDAEDIIKQIQLSKVDNIDFFEIKEDSIGEKQVKMNEDFEAGAIWGWNEARKRLEQNIK